MPVHAVCVLTTCDTNVFLTIICPCACSHRVRQHVQGEEVQRHQAVCRKQRLSDRLLGCWASTVLYRHDELRCGLVGKLICIRVRREGIRHSLHIQSDSARCMEVMTGDI